MDVYCQKCGEPWDIFELNEFSAEDGGTDKDFCRGKGCPSCHWGADKAKPGKKGILAALLCDVLGDDIDGIAAELEDAGFLGLFDD